MNKERDTMRNIVSSACNKEGIAKRCPERISEALIKAGYGDTKQAVREFAERLKEKIDRIEEHCLEMHNWQGQSAVCEVEENIDELLAEVTGE